MAFLNRKYPFFVSSNHWFRDAAIYCCVVFLILYLLQPFGFSMYPGNKLLVASSFGVATFACCVIYDRAILYRLPLRVKTWRIWHHILAVLGLLVFISLSNSFLFSVWFLYPMTLAHYMQILYWTLLVGSLITFIAIATSYNHHLHTQLETMLNNTREEQKEVEVTLYDQNVRGTDLTLPINDLLYIEANKNNVLVYYVKEGKTTQAELHSSLSSMLADLKDYENIIQCHRSFIINVNNITSAKGNSNGYQLQLGKCPHVVPVSRSYVGKLKSFIA